MWQYASEPKKRNSFIFCIISLFNTTSQPEAYNVFARLNIDLCNSLLAVSALGSMVSEPGSAAAEKMTRPVGPVVLNEAGRRPEMIKQFSHQNRNNIKLEK